MRQSFSDVGRWAGRPGSARAPDDRPLPPSLRGVRGVQWPAHSARLSENGHDPLPCLPRCGRGRHPASAGLHAPREPKRPLLHAPQSMWFGFQEEDINTHGPWGGSNVTRALTPPPTFGPTAGRGARAAHGVVERRGWTPGTTHGGVEHLGLTHTETRRGGLWTRCVGSKNRQTTPATTSTTLLRQLLGSADAQTAPAASSTAPAHQLLGSANAETTPAGAPAAAVDRKQRPDATCEGKNG